MILKNLQPYTVIQVECTTIGEELANQPDGEKAVELLKENGFEELLNSKQYIEGRTLAICENSGEAAKLSDWANKTRYANDPNFFTRIRSARYEIVELSTDLVNRARLTCESCGSDLIISEHRENYVCEKCGKEHSLMKKAANQWGKLCRGSDGKEVKREIFEE